LLFVAY
jgi:hypothetical protein